jgi:hypothetical protein
MTDYSDAFFGSMAFQDGKVVAASTSRGNKGTEAAYDLVAALRGSFEFRPDIPAGVSVEMTLSVENLLLEALRRRDEQADVELDANTTQAMSVDELPQVATAAATEASADETSDDLPRIKELDDTHHDEPEDPTPFPPPSTDSPFFRSA